MKKAIVIAITMMLGLGLTALAGPLSGSWASSLVVDPAASSFTSLSSTLAVDYTLSGWTFGCSSGFTLDGFSSQSFTAGGSFGAFTLSSTMVFDPMFVTRKTYVYLSELPAYYNQTGVEIDALCDRTYTSTTAPQFLTWKTEGGISIGGVELGALFYIDQSNTNVELVDYVFVDTHTAGTAWSVTSYLNGSGWRFKVAGSIGDITATSYTYFNLNEPDTSSLSTAYCPTVGKSGTLSIVGGDCDPSFYEEYILLEGIALGCATIDAGLSILCTGFNYVSFVVSDVAIGEWLELDFGLVFTTSSKTTDFCLTATKPESDCFTIEFGLNNGTHPDTTGAIDSINFYGIGFSYAWEAIMFTSYTELSANSALFSTAGAYDYLNGSAKQGFLSPFLGYRTETDKYVLSYVLPEYSFELKCLPTYRFRLWEKFIIDIDGDACCGGALDLTISTWFGDKEVLSWVGYQAYQAGGVSLWYDEVLKGTVPDGTFDDFTADADDDTVSFKYGYRADTGTTLFSWAKTEVDASVGVASNITLDLGFNVSAFGWESLEVGFTFEF
jgi:hypothetical protein